MNRALVYTRVSTDDQAEHGQSLEVQEKLCRKFAEGKGIEVVEIYADAGKSGSDPNRQGLKGLLQNCKDDPTISMVIMQDIDRLARDTLLFMMKMSEFKEMGVEVKFINQPTIDEGLEGKLTGTIQAGVAEFLAK